MTKAEKTPESLAADERKQARNSVETTAGIAAVCAMITAIGCAYQGAAWPGAVAASAIALLGTMVSIFQLRSASRIGPAEQPWIPPHVEKR